MSDLKAGRGKKQSETWIKASLYPDILMQHIKEYNGIKYIPININISEPDKHGKDVKITIDTYEPKNKK